MVERIRTLLESRQLTPTQFADAIGVARPIVSHILSGRNKPSLEVVQRILAAMPDLAMPWLLNGTGEMLATPIAAANLVVAPAPIPTAPTPSVAPVATTPLASVIAQNEVQPSVIPAPNPGLNVLQTADLLGKIGAQRYNDDAGGTQVVLNGLPNQATPGVATSGSANAPALPRTMAAPKRFTAVQNAKAPSPEPVVAQGDAESPPTPSTTAPEPAIASAMPTVSLPPPVEAPIVPADEPAPSIPPKPTSDVTAASPLASALFAGAEKPIRRIVIFYRDGSFADYQPE